MRSESPAMSVPFSLSCISSRRNSRAGATADTGTQPLSAPQVPLKTSGVSPEARRARKAARGVPTRSMPEALAALVVYDPEAEATDNASEMTDAAESVATGEVTQAVRSTNSEAGPVNEGDWMGLVRGAKNPGEGGIVAVSDTLEGAVVALLEQLVGPTAEIITVVEGRDATGGQTDMIRTWLGENRPDVQVEVHRGGQPLYPYLFGVE